MNTQSCPTGKLEKMVLAADVCEFCEGAVREAINLAKACNSKLYAVSVVEVNQEFEALAPGLVEKMEKETRGFLEAVKTRAGKAGVDCETRAHQGEEAHIYIVKEAGDVGADMIVMGRRGRKGLKKLLMGSVTAQVIGHAPCSVLVVPSAARTEFKNIVVATDGSKYSDAAASVAAGIARRRGGRLTAVSVEHPEAGEADANLKRVLDMASREGIQAEALVLKGRPYEAIVAKAKELAADTIVVGSHGRTGLEKLLMGSVAERVIGLSECAVLVVKGR
jgi:nucleotide-binding universal stress UspA family protein